MQQNTGKKRRVFQSTRNFQQDISRNNRRNFQDQKVPCQRNIPQYIRQNNRVIRQNYNRKGNCSTRTNLPSQRRNQYFVCHNVTTYIGRNFQKRVLEQGVYYKRQGRRNRNTEHLEYHSNTRNNGNGRDEPQTNCIKETEKIQTKLLISLKENLQIMK